MKKQIQLTSEFKYQLLRDISHKIRGTLDLDEILNLLLDLLANVIDYDAAGIFVLSEDINHPGYHFLRQKIASMAQRGFGNIPKESDAMLMEGKGLVGYTIKSGKSLIVNDVRKDKRYIPGRKQTLSEITFPIIKNGKTIGCLNIESDKLASFAKSDVEILNFFADTAAISIEKALLHYQILEKNKIEEQLQLAKNVQVSLLPSEQPKIRGYQFGDVCIPAYEIGGDYFDYIKIDKSKIAIIIADVSGDGVPAALMMSAFRALLRYNARLVISPAKLMKVMNEQVPEFMRKRDFISAFYGIIDTKEHSFTYANCGHNPGIFLSRDSALKFLEGTGPSLNLLKDAGFIEEKIYLEKGDQIILYTDGVVEVFAKDRNQYGMIRLINIIKETSSLPPSKIIKSIINSTREFSHSDVYNDDFTIVAFKRNA